MKQPEALRLADLLGQPDQDNFITSLDESAATELRRLHAETTNQSDWYVEWQKWELRAKELEALNEDMLAALKNAQSELLAAGFGSARDYNWPTVMAQVEAAIAKATGTPTLQFFDELGTFTPPTL